jgi:FkbM family methyltransferase
MIRYLRYQADHLRTRWRIGDVSIKLPRGHALPALQRHHLLYDRFLPILVNGRSSHEWIIDVGANVGDTATALVQVCDAKILCIEASTHFYKYLQRNHRHLEEKYPKRIYLENAFAGTGEVKGTLVESLGSAHVEIGATKDISNVPRLNLDEIVAQRGIADRDIFLVKSDVDGFDYDVMSSGARVLKESSALLYWENQIQTPSQLEGYLRYFDFLQLCGYSHFWLFDNFGRLMIPDTTIATLRSLSEYLYAQNAERARGIYYIDVLGAKPSMRGIAQQRVDSYLAFAAATFSKLERPS